MKIYNSYILITVLLLMITTVILIAIEQTALDIYFTIYIIEALIVTELFVYFNNKARRGLGFISTVLFGGFMIIVSLEVIKVLT